MRVAIVVFVLWVSLILCLRNQHDLEPNFCDPFGYARQAELFREHGLWKGLDTAIDTPQSRWLVTEAKAALPGSTAWFDPVAPLCHHYERRSGKIILQYPPGTGMLLALFPFAYAMPFLQIVGSLLVACLVTWLAISYRLSKVAALAMAVAVALLFWVLARNLAYWSASIPATMLLVSSAFFSTHTIHTHYYLVASSFMAIAMVAIDLSTAQPKRKTPMAYLWLLPLLAITGVAFARVKPYQPDIRAPEEIMDPQAVVWANEHSGTLYYVDNRYASKLHRTEPPMQDALVDMVMRAHRPQYFVVDSQHALEACDRQAARYGMSYIGTLSARPPASVWKLGDGSGGFRSCASPAEP